MDGLSKAERNALLSYLEADSGRGDLTGFLFEGRTGSAIVFPERNCILSGIEAAIFLFDAVGAKVKVSKGARSGNPWKKGKVVLEASGPVEGLLRAERVVLNVLSRMSGIATRSRELSDRARKAHPSCRVAGTRKTTPGFSLFEKRALIEGGALTHRMDLSSMPMVKDNHLVALGGGPEAIELAVAKLRERHGPFVKVEVEVESMEEALTALRSGADIIMLDNMGPERVKKVSRELRREAAAEGREITIEASGGIGPEDLSEYAPHVDVISLGRLTYDVPIIGFKMEVRRR